MDSQQPPMANGGPRPSGPLPPVGRPPGMPPGPPMPQQPMHGQPMPPQLQRNLPPVGPGGYPVMNRQMSEQMASGATVFPSDLGSGPHDSQRAADLASPVGANYRGDVDWAAAAAAPARALPPWMLAALFVAALGAALLVTILIARLVR